MPQVQQAIDLGHVPAEAARKLGLLDAGLAHGLVEREFRGREGGEGYHLLATARTRGARDSLAVADERSEGGLQRVGRAGQGVGLVVAKGERDGDVGEAPLNRPVIVRLEIDWIGVHHGIVALPRSRWDWLFEPRDNERTSWAACRCGGSDHDRRPNDHCVSTADLTNRMRWWQMPGPVLVSLTVVGIAVVMRVYGL